MTKRIVSGIFILTALGALGVILAGALSSGEQLIVRFLTAVVVAALGLYVISDLRLDADRQSAGSRTRFAGVDVPANSTAAFMATVTSKDVPTVLSPLVPIDAEQPSTLVMSDLDPQDDTSTDAESPAEAPAGAEALDERAVAEPAGLDGVRLATVGGDDQKLGTVNGDHASSLAKLFSPKLDADDLEVWGGVDMQSSAPEEPATPPEVEVEVEPTSDVEPAAEAEVSVEAADAGEAFPSTPPPPQETAPAQAVADFEYSGDLEATGCDSWPPAEESSPGADLASTTAEEPSEAFLARLEGEQSTPVGSSEDDTDGLAAGDRPESVESEALDQPVAEEAPAPSPSTSLNGAEHSLPAPATVSSPSEYVDAPLAPIIDLRTPVASDSNIEAAIDAGEIQVIAALIEQGMLSVDGPISDRDVRTMVYVAFTSNELRKLLLAGGRPDMPNPDLDLGPVELFPSSEADAPAPALPVGLPAPAEARTQLG